MNVSGPARCTITYGRGKFCDREAVPDAPVVICARHLIQVYQFAQDVLDLRDGSRMGIPYQPIQVDPDGPEVVYYLRVNGLIKIGTTVNLKRRLMQYPPGSELLATEPGGYPLEDLRLRQYRRQLYAPREWFHAEEPLLSHIASLVEAQSA